MRPVGQIMGMLLSSAGLMQHLLTFVKSFTFYSVARKPAKHFICYTVIVYVVCLFNLCCEQFSSALFVFYFRCCPQAKKQRTPCGPYQSASWPPCLSVSSPTSVCLLLSPWWCRTTSWTPRALCPRPSVMSAGLLPDTLWLWAPSALCPPGKERT